MTPQELHLSILERAFQGHLTERMQEEGTGAELLDIIKAEKLRLAKAKLIKKEKELPSIAEDDAHFDIPETWTWAYVGDIFLHNTGKAQNSSGSENGVVRKFITTSNLYWNRFDFSKVKEMPFTEKELERCTVKKGDLLVCEGGDCGRSAIWNYDEEVCIQNHVHRLRPYVDISIEYFYHLFYLYKFTGKLRGRGVGIQGLSNEAIHQVICPLPPVAEQKRIVEKIEELLPYIDRYEQAWSKLEEFNKRFPVDMQKSIIQMAIQGKLVPQLSEEGTAFSLKEKLHNKKLEWTTAGKILKKAETKPFLNSDDLFDIPDSWEWVQLSDVSIIQEGAGIRKWQYRDAGTQILCVTNILEGSIDQEKKQLYISTEEYLEKYKHLTLNKGDIVTSCSGGSWGKIAFFDCEDTMMLNTSTLRMRFFDDIADNNYLFYVCKSPFFKRQLELQLSGMQPNFGYAHYSRIVLPLPPLAEQKRIVAKLEEILPLCERLK